MSNLLRRRRTDTEPTAVDQQEAEIRKALESLRTTNVREVMTPRVDVIALREPVNIGDVASAVRESGHSRFPVYQEDLDQLVGVLFVKDLFRSGAWNTDTTEADIKKLVRKPFFVPESRPLLALLQEMRKRRVAFAVVTDEHGGVEGVLTIKDLISELVGDIHDEFDSEPETEIQRVDAQRWLIDGGTNVEDVTTETGLPIPEGEYVTLGGFLMWLLGRIPVDGDVCEFEGFELKVEEMDKRRVSQVIVRAPSGTVSESESQDIDTGM
jgi:CBS domain containing-hemolysin-like protein